MNVDQWRKETPGCKDKIHFNNAGASLMPQPVIQAMKDHIDLEAKEGGYEAADKTSEEINKFYAAVAQLVNTKPGNIAFTSSATNSYARALSCIPFEKGDTILIANEDYISNQLALLSMQKRMGISILRADSRPAGGVDVDHMKKLMDRHRPKLISLTHVPTNSGLVQPVEEVGRLCREQNLTYLVDACQSAGQLPLDVKKIGCDFLSATFRKFLRGPRGSGFLFVSDNILGKDWEPLFIDMRGADWVEADEYKVRADARKFEDWELPYILVLGSKAATEYALSAGIESIEKRNNELCGILRQKLAGLPVRILDQGKKLSSIITVAIEGWEPVQLQQQLRQRNINTSISYRNYAVIDFDRKGVQWALRISPHYYNTEKEIDILISNLKELLT